MTTKLLVLASNPQGTTPLRLNTEIREIEEALEQSQNREQFTLRSQLAVRVEDLEGAIRSEKARIVHWGGHGAGSQGLVLATLSGQPQLLETGALADLFKLFATQVECVVLNASYSYLQALAIHQHINYVIGMKQSIKDATAISFTQGFYTALFNGASIEQAFELGRNYVTYKLDGTSNRERTFIPVSWPSELNQYEHQHEIMELLIKEPRNKIVDASE